MGVTWGEGFLCREQCLVGPEPTLVGQRILQPAQSQVADVQLPGLCCSCTRLKGARVGISPELFHKLILKSQCSPSEGAVCCHLSWGRA